VVRIKLTDRGGRLVDGMLAEHMRQYARLLEPLDERTRVVVADALRTLLEVCE
jgi:DNA-binding MarR family transcriptional regulator